MKEVKKPSKKPLVYYYGIMLLVLIVLNALVVPKFAESSIIETDYGTFMDMIDQKNIGQVEIQDNQILFTDKDNKQIYKTGLMNDPTLTERLHESGAKFASEIITEASPLLSFLISWLFPILLFVILGQILSKRMGKMMDGAGGSMAFGMGNSGAKVYVPSSTGIRFEIGRAHV